MPNINFKFDADSSKVERAIKRLGTEFEKVVSTGDNIDKTLIDFGALVDKNADKIQNLKSEMQKLNAVNLQNMAQQFERINAGGFNELIQGLRNVQTGVVGTENSIENLITKLGLSKNSIQQVANSMRQALGNMGYGSAEYTATLSQLNILEQALGRIDQTVTASASNTVAANQNKITSAQNYMNTIRTSNQQFEQEMSGRGGGSRESWVEAYATAFTHLLEIARQSRSQFEVEMQKYPASTQKALLEVEKYLDGMSKTISGDMTGGESYQKAFDSMMLKLKENFREDQTAMNGFSGFMQSQLDDLIASFLKTEKSYEETLASIQTMRVSDLASVDDIEAALARARKAMQNLGTGNTDGSQELKNLTRLEEQFSRNKLDKIVADLKEFSMNVSSNADLVKKTFELLADKTEVEINSILNELNRLKQNTSIDTNQYKGLVAQIGAVNEVVQRTARANQALSGSSSSATMAIQQLGFAVGDAGMITQNWRGALAGIGNNLPFIAQGIMEMNAAAKAAGTTGLKAFGAALTGPAGILLGINAAIFALQVLPDIFAKISNSSVTTAKALKSTKDILKELTAAMKVSTVLSDDSTRSTLAEGVAFKELTTRLQATTAGTKERKVVVDQIQAAYPEYIKNIDLNKTSEKELAKWVRDSTAALYGKIKAMLLDKLIEKNADALVEATASYQIAVENDAKVKKEKKTNNKSDNAIYDKEGNLVGYGETPTDAKAADNYLKRTKKELDKVTAEFNKNLTLSTTIAESVMKSLGFDPSLANTDPDALKDMNKELKGEKPKKQDEYTALEELSDKWDKIIAKESDAKVKEDLRYAKALAIWDLTKKTIKDKADFNKAEIAYLEAVMEYSKIIEARRKENSDKLFARMSKEYEDQVKIDKAQEATDEEMTKRRLEANEMLLSLSERAKTEGMSEGDRLTFDEQKELNEVAIDEYGMKEERMTQIKAYYAKKRAKLEEASWEKQMSIIANFLNAAGSLFQKNTLAYKTLAIASATVDTYKAANLALASSPPPFNYIEMATVIASGLANVASIVDTEVTGYAKGGLIDRPHLGLVGEAGAEIIAPVRDFASYSKELVQAAVGGMGGGKELSVTVKGSDLVFTLQKATKKVNRQKVGGKL